MTDYITDTAPDAAAPGDEAVLDGTPEVVVETTEHPEPLPQDFAEFGVRQDIVDSLEHGIDAFERVANIVEQIAVKES